MLKYYKGPFCFFFNTGISKSNYRIIEKNHLDGINRDSLPHFVRVRTTTATATKKNLFRNISKRLDSYNNSFNLH